MTHDRADAERLTTGVPGLDRVLGGGLRRGCVHLVEGPAGAGKTILGNQICYHHADNGSAAVYMTLLAESHTRLIGHLRELRFFRADVVGQRLHYVSGFKTLEAEGVSALARMGRETVTAHKATLLVIDGLISAIDSAESSREYKKFVHELQTIAALTQCTVILLSSTEHPRSARPEHTMVDGIIELSDDLDGLRSERQLQVQKLRGSDPVRGRHTLTITSDGVSVRPRIEADLLRLPEDTRLEPGRARVTFGLPELDEMLHGGLPSHSTTMILGPSGTGKTILGLHYLVAGAQQGDLGIYFGFFERPKTLVAKAARLGLKLGELQARGALQLLWEPYGEGSIDSLGDRLLSAVRKYQPSRLCLDGVQGFYQGKDPPERLSSVLSAITEELEAQGVTSVYTMENRDLYGSVISSPIQGVSAVTHNIILLRYAELDAKLHRLIAVLKLRDSGHDSGVRELCITDSGVRLVDTFAGAEGVLTGHARRSATLRAPVREVWPQAREESPVRAVKRQLATVLIVDDEFGLADVLAEILNERGYATSIAINGELGLRALEERRPDLVLLDIMMPVISGIDMMERMKAHPDHAKIPIVLMTALPEAVPPGSGELANAILQKPFTPEQLFEVVERCLAKAGEQPGS